MLNRAPETLTRPLSLSSFPIPAKYNTLSTVFFFLLHSLPGLGLVRDDGAQLVRCSLVDDCFGQSRQSQAQRERERERAHTHTYIYTYTVAMASSLFSPRKRELWPSSAFSFLLAVYWLGHCAKFCGAKVQRRPSFVVCLVCVCVCVCVCICMYVCMYVFIYVSVSALVSKPT